MIRFSRTWARLFLCAGFVFFAAGLVYAGNPEIFIENLGQWGPDVRFAGRVPGGRMVLGATGFRYYFVDRERLAAMHLASHAGEPGDPDDLLRGHAIFVDFPGASPAAITPVGRSQAYYNFYIGNDPSKWASRVYAYEGVIYESFFSQIDLKVYSVGDHVKYDFIVAPGGDPSVIGAVYHGADRLFLQDGDLVVRTSLGDVIERAPVAWQLIDGQRVDVSCGFQLDGNRVSLVFPEGFDACYELVVDPLLIFSTYSGSTADNWGSTATPGEHGNLYSAGVTSEFEGGNFPATPGAYQLASSGLYDIGILKYDSLGSDLLYATYFGGSGNDSPHSLVVNSANELLLLGTTGSNDFPTTAGAFDRLFRGGQQVLDVIGYPYLNGCDMVISRFSSDGTALLASTFVGGSANDGLNIGGGLTRNYGDQLRGDIITDRFNNVYVSSVTSSGDFPVSASFDMSYNGGATDGVLFMMDPNLSSMSWSMFIGGTGTDAAYSLKIDEDGDIFVAGGTTSADFPVSADSHQPGYAGNVDGWIAKVAGDGSSILRATFTGTNQYNQVYFLDLNAAGEVYVYGQTTGTNFPVSPGVYSNPGSGQFVQKFTHNLDSLVFSTVFGSGRGIPDISPTAFLVNDCNNVYMAGWGGTINNETGYWIDSGTNGMPVTPDAFQSSTSGSDFYFLVLTDDAKERLYATFLGGNLSSTHVDGGTSRFDKSGIVYHTVCSGCRYYNQRNQPTSDFPTTPGAWSGVNRSLNCNNAAFKFDLSSLKARIRTNSERRDAPGLAVVCLPDAFGFENLSTGGEIYYWDFGDGVTDVRTDTTFIIHHYKAPGKYTVSLAAVDQGTCQVIDQTSVVVTVNISNSFIQEDADLCFGSGYQLQASGGASYHWVSADGSFISSAPNPTVSPTDTMQYYIILTEPNGCVRKDTVQINVIPAIAPDFEWWKVAECTERPRIAVLNRTDSLKAGDSWFFDFGDGATADLDGVEHVFSKDGIYDVRLVTQREFCVYEKSVAIPVFRIFVPNVITPSVQGHNDVFLIRYGDDNDVSPATFGYRVSLSIHNRWGETVFETDDYQYDWSGDGLPAGTYFYELTVEGHATCKGWVHVIK